MAIYQSVTSTGVQTFSIYAKANTTDWVFLNFSGIASSGAYFDLANGVTGTIQGNVINAEIKSSTNGYYRISITASGTASIAVIYVADANNTISGTSGSIYIQDAQLVEGTEPLDYQYTNGLQGLPRISFEDGVGHLLLEPQRSNLLLQSNQFDTTWSGSASTLSGQNGVYGTSDAWLITKSGVFDSRRQVITNSGIATFSVYAKSSSYNWMLLHIEDAAGDCLANFDLSTGTLGTLTNGITSKIEDIGSGWYRCSATFNRNLSDVRIYPSESGGYTGSSGSIYIQHAP